MTGHECVPLDVDGQRPLVAVVSMLDVTADEKTLLTVLALDSWDGEDAAPARCCLLRWCGWSNNKDRLQNARARLASRGLLTWVSGRGRGVRTRYTFHLAEKVAASPPTKPPTKSAEKVAGLLAEKVAGSPPMPSLSLSLQEQEESAREPEPKRWVVQVEPLCRDVFAEAGSWFQPDPSTYFTIPSHEVFWRRVLGMGDNRTSTWGTVANHPPVLEARTATTMDEAMARVRTVLLTLATDPSNTTEPEPVSVLAELTRLVREVEDVDDERPPFDSDPPGPEPPSVDPAPSDPDFDFLDALKRDEATRRRAAGEDEGKEEP